MEEQRVKKPKKKNLYVIIILLAAFILIIPIIKKSNLGIFNITDKSQKKLKLVKKIDTDKNVKSINLYDDKIIQWKENSLSFIDFDGREAFRKDFKFKDPDVLFGEETIYVMDKLSGEIDLLDKTGESMGKIESKSSFNKLKEDGENLLIFKEEDNKEIVYIIDRQGKLLKTHEENKPILTISVNNRSLDYLVSTIDLDDELKSKVTIYSENREEIFSLDIKDEIVVYSNFIKDNILLATDKSLYFLENGNIKWEKRYGQLKDIELINNKIFILYGNKLETLNFKGKLKEEIVLKVPLEKISYSNGEMLLFDKKNITIPGKDKNRLDFKTEEVILDIKQDDENLLIIKEDKIEIYNMKKKESK